MDMNQPNSQQTNPLANYQFSAEELKVLKECNRISFYQRSLPTSAILGGVTYYAVKAGYFKGNPRFGAMPKVCAAVAVGYFMGKISFQSQCAEMLMRIPNSRLAEVLRQRKKGAIYSQLSPDQGFGTGLSLQPFSSYADTYSDERQLPKGSVLDMDVSRPTAPGLDDVYRPNLDSPTMRSYDDINLPLEPPKTTVSYDELRKKNREEYYQKQPNVRPPSPPIQRAPPPPAQEAANENAFGDVGSTPPLGKNKYGDVWIK